MCFASHSQGLETLGLNKRCWNNLNFEDGGWFGTERLVEDQ